MALPLIAGLGVPLGTTTLSPSVLTAQDATVPARDIATRFQSEMEVLHREYGFPGMTAAYVLPDGSTGHVAVGMADVEGRRAMTTASTMLAASVGKTFVGATVLALAEEGRLTLDDRVADWLGDRVWFERLPNHDAITLRHLLNHTSGLSNHVESARFAGYMAEEWSALNDPKPEELIAYALDQPPLFAPGDGWSYSDTGYLLLGLVVERASGRTYYQELNSRFLTPLRLENTVPSNRRELPELATGYTEADNPFGLPTRTTTRFGIMAWHPGIEWTGGGLASTPLDLVRWARALFEGEALAGTYLDEMLAFVPLDEVGRAGYGLGVAVRRDDVLGTNVGHGGWIPGYCTSLRYYTDHGVGIALQINTDVGMMEGSPTPVDRIEARLARVVIEANRAESRPPTSGSP
jgi:D-alanyl-D-alanine carboxypeptidase